ncbi:acyltransferase family protein [Parafilimonas sp.]|uniref:acyltransferase family protein n=1 Tax=Parafilimonas sp. TaxID=1969739 RepID=UPI0039E6ADDE
MTDCKPQKQSWLSRAFNLTALQKSRLYWIDYLKGIAIVLVVYRHSLLGIQGSGELVPGYLESANMIFYSFRMPLFFMLSGIFASLSLRKRTVKQYIESKFETLLYPYFIWATIQITLQIALSGFTNSNRGLIDYTYLLYQPRNLDQFWYLPALFNAAVVYVLIKKYITRKWWLLLLIALAFYFLSPYLQRISMISDWMEFYIFFAVGDIISKMFFHERVQHFFRSPITFLAAIPFFILAQLFYLGNDMYYLTSAIMRGEFLFIAFTGCFTMIALSFMLQRWNVFKWLRIIGYHSIYIYVMHVMVAAFARTVITHFLDIHNVFVILFFCIAAGCIVPVLIYNLFIRDNFAWFLFTYKKRKKTIQNGPIAQSPFQATLS